MLVSSHSKDIILYPFCFANANTSFSILVPSLSLFCIEQINDKYKMSFSSYFTQAKAQGRFLMELFIFNFSLLKYAKP